MDSRRALSVRQLTWSRRLRDWAGMHVELTEDEIAQTDMTAPPLKRS
jgi:hypothetical protein